MTLDCSTLTAAPTASTPRSPHQPQAHHPLLTAARWLLLVAYNLAWLPLLLVVPDAHVDARARRQRHALLHSKSASAVLSVDPILWVVWLVPCGRAALRFASALVLALALTARLPSASSVSAWDVLIALYAASIAESSATHLIQVRASARTAD